MGSPLRHPTVVRLRVHAAFERGIAASMSASAMVLWLDTYGALRARIVGGAVVKARPAPTHQLLSCGASCRVSLQTLTRRGQP